MSLSEKTNLGIVTHTNQRQYEWVKLDDVREAVKELKKEISDSIDEYTPDDEYDKGWNAGAETFIELIDRIFGEKLV